MQSIQTHRLKLCVITFLVLAFALTISNETARTFAQNDKPNSQTENKSNAVVNTNDALELFVSNCARCHGDNGKGETALGVKLNTPDFTTAKFHKNHNDKKLREAITNGEDKKMPAFGKKLSSEQIETLIKYVRTFKPEESKKR